MFESAFTLKLSVSRERGSTAVAGLLDDDLWKQLGLAQADAWREGPSRRRHVDPRSWDRDRVPIARHESATVRFPGERHGQRMGPVVLHKRLRLGEQRMAIDGIAASLGFERLGNARRADQRRHAAQHQNETETSHGQSPRIP